MSSERRVRLSVEAWAALETLSAAQQRKIPDTASRVILAALAGQEKPLALELRVIRQAKAMLSEPPQFAHKRGKR